METNKRTPGQWYLGNQNMILSDNGEEKEWMRSSVCQIMGNARNEGEDGHANASFIVTACNNYDALVEENRKLKQALDMVTRIFIYSSKGEFKVEDKVKATELAVRVLIGSGITNIGETFEKTTAKGATKDE